MMNFFKREFGPYFRDFSEYDFKFFRTFRDSFLRPEKVIEANDGTYTGELKFTFNVFTVLFILYYLSDPSWIEGIEIYKLWRYPIPHQRYLRLEQSIDEDYYGYIMAIAFIPLYFILLKLLFYKRKPWGFFLSASFYLTSVIFTLLIAVVFLLNLLNTESELIIIPALLIITTFPVVALRLQRWFWSGLKAIVAALLPLLFISISLERSLFNLIINLSINEEVLEMKPENERILSSEQLPIEPGGIQQAVMMNEKEFVVLGFENLSWYKEGAFIKEIPLRDYYNKKIERLDDGSFLVACFHDQEKETEIVLTHYSSVGDSISTKRIKSKSKNSDLSTRKMGKNHFIVFVSDAQIEMRENEEWKLSLTDSTSEINTINSYTSLGEGLTLRQTIKRATHHVLSFQVALIDTTDQIKWERQVFQKQSPFDPLDLLMTHVDTTENIVYTHYTLANDSVYYSYLSAIDISDGALIWNSQFTLAANVTEYGGLTGDEHFIYLYGEGHKFYSDWFWQPTYHVGLLVKIDKRSGQYINHFFLGPQNWGAHSHVFSLFPKGDKLHLLTFDIYKDPLPWQDVDDLLLKTVDKDF